jgi:transposase
MESDDARKLSPAALEQLRKQATRLKKQGKGPTEIGRILAMRHTVSDWWRRYQDEGTSGLKLAISAKRVSTNMISAITNQGKVRFMLYPQGMNAQLLIKFLKRLIDDSEHKVFLILDNLRVHHAKVVRQWLEKHTEEIEVFYLPAYSSELNPDEYLNYNLKVGVHSRPPVCNERQLRETVVSHMRKLQKLPGRNVK